MNKKTIISFIVIVLMVGAWFIADSILSKSYIMPEFSDKDKVFMKGSYNDVKEFLDNSERGVHLTNFYSLIRRERNDILEMVIRDYNYRADLNAKDLQLATPLYFAAQEFKPESVRVLIKYGADVNYQDPYGMTPLIVASYTTHEHENTKSLEITKMLVEAGADIDSVSKFGYTAIGRALSLGSDNMDRVRYLVNKGADINYIDADGSNYMFYCNTTQCIKFFIQQGLDINSSDKTGENLIQSSASGRFKTIGEIRQLLELGANICHKDDAGDTVLNYVERQNTGPHDKKEKPEYYQKRLTENRASETYRFLEQKYQESCSEEA